MKWSSFRRSSEVALLDQNIFSWLLTDFFPMDFNFKGIPCIAQRVQCLAGYFVLSQLVCQILKYLQIISTFDKPVTRSGSAGAEFFTSDIKGSSSAALITFYCHSEKVTDASSLVILHRVLSVNVCAWY